MVIVSINRQVLSNIKMSWDIFSGQDFMMILNLIKLVSIFTFTKFSIGFVSLQKIFY